MPSLYDVYCLYIPRCSVCHHAHLFYLFPHFSTDVPELWFVSTNRDSLLADDLFPKDQWSGEVTPARSSYNYDLEFSQPSLCILDVPNRVLLLDAEFFLELPFDQVGEIHEPLFYWHRLLDG